MRGAGGTSGGVGQFFLGLLMASGGFYMLLNAITVSTQFSLASRLFSVSALGGMGVTGGMILIPLIFGLGLIFYSGSNVIGWLLSIGSLAALIFGVLSSVQFHLRTMSAFDLIVILVLCAGGCGLFLRSLKTL